MAGTSGAEARKKIRLYRSAEALLHQEAQACIATVRRGATQNPRLLQICTKLKRAARAGCPLIKTQSNYCDAGLCAAGFFAGVGVAAFSNLPLFIVIMKGLGV